MNGSKIDMGNGERFGRENSGGSEGRPGSAAEQGRCDAADSEGKLREEETRKKRRIGGKFAVRKRLEEMMGGCVVVVVGCGR
jgi:hypothetical protein